MPPISQRTSSPSGKIYTWDDVRAHNSLEDCWIVVQGKVYDVSSWAPRHPGGSIMVTGAGRDSTAFMYSYHPRYVMDMLDQYYKGELEGYDHYYKWDSKFYTTLKQRVDKYMKENALTRDSVPMYFKTLLIVLLWLATYYLGMVKGYMIAAMLLGVFHSQLGINIMHDGNHGAYSSSPRMCAIAAFVMDLMGSSSIVWLHQHNVGHHPNSNNSDNTKSPASKLDPHAFDPDANGGFPFIRLNPTQPIRPYMRYQHLYVWLLICLMNFKWFINDIRAVNARRYTFIDFHHLTDREVFTLYLTKAIFILYAVVVPIYLHGLSGLLNFLAFMVVCGHSFVLMFSVNHLTEDSTFPDNNMAVESRDWAILQVMTSSNFANDSTFWTMVSGGLNFQIEHHLFPGVNHMHLSKISPIVKSTCKEFGIPYQSFPTFFSAVRSYYAHLKNLGRAKME